LSFYGAKDFGLEVSLGNVPGYATVFQFGRSTDCDLDDPTDLWDGADGVTSTKIWVPPTVARIHDLASTSAADDNDAGTGMRTVVITGLTDWDTPQVQEVVTLDGITNVPTVNSYVIIHRMLGLTYGSGATNAGIITATAQTDLTVTAAILAGKGQTRMAIYGVPSTQTLAITTTSFAILGTASPTATIEIFAFINPDTGDGGEISADLASVSESGWNQLLKPPGPIPGPHILKFKGTASANNSIVTASFGAYLVDNDA
jgi:hypothetical protein